MADSKEASTGVIVAIVVGALAVVAAGVAVVVIVRRRRAMNPAAGTQSVSPAGVLGAQGQPTYAQNPHRLSPEAELKRRANQLLAHGVGAAVKPPTEIRAEQAYHQTADGRTTIEVAPPRSA